MPVRTSSLRRAQEALDGGDFARARALAEEALHAIEASPAPRKKTTGGLVANPSRAEARRLLAIALLYDDKAEDAERIAREAVGIARAAGSKREMALGELALAEILRSRGDYVAGLKHASRAQRLAARSGDPRAEAMVLSDYALLLSRVGDDERAREAFDRLLGGPLVALPRARALRVLYNAAMAHRAAGRFSLALQTLDRASQLPKGPRSAAAEWALTAARLMTLADMGAYEDVHTILQGIDETELKGGWQRAQLAAFRAGLALATGSRGELVDKYIAEGLAIRGLEAPVRFAIERLRALSLMQRGRSLEAERIAVALTEGAAKGGTRAHAAQALAIAARAGAPGSWLLRWLGALACASGGSAARTEHEALAALLAEPDPVGRLVRNALVIVRARLLDNTPAEYRTTMMRSLRHVEHRTAAARRATRSEAESTAVIVGEDVLRAKEEIGIAGDSPALVQAVATGARAARSNASLVLSGETGSGKELFARLVHRLSLRARAPFVALNCAAIPQPLLEAELFGHERGAFTGAARARHGLFVEAEGGTLFLDEVGEMSAAMQAKLLRVLEDGEVRAVGGSRTRKVDVRVIAATHRDLAQMVGDGQFREDLYYRLAAMTVRIPPLRERIEDLPAIVLALLSRDPETRHVHVDDEAMALLAQYGWPGNVRELANVLRRAAAMIEGTVIARGAVDRAIGSALARRTETTKPTTFDETTLSALRARHRRELRELVSRTLEGAKGNKRKAAQALGVSRQGLYRVLED